MDEEKKAEYLKVLSLGFYYAFKAFTKMIDYCELDLVNFHSIKKFFRYGLYNNLKRIMLYTFIISFIGLIDRSSIFFPVFFWISLFALMAFFLFDFRIIKIFSYNENFYRKQKKFLIRNIISIKILGNNELVKELKIDTIKGKIKTLEQKIDDFSKHKNSFINILDKYSILITIFIPLIPITLDILKNPTILSSIFNLISFEDIFVITTIIVLVVYQVYYNSNLNYIKKKGLLLYLEAIYSTLTFVISTILKSLEFPLEETEKKDLKKIFNRLKENKSYDISQMKDLEVFFKKINELDIDALKFF